MPALSSVVSTVCAPATNPKAVTPAASRCVSVSTVCAPVEKPLFATKASTSASDNCVFVSVVWLRSLICDSVMSMFNASTPALSKWVSVSTV